MSEPEIDIAALVRVALTAFGPRRNPEDDMRAILTAVLPLVLAGPREALKPFGYMADRYDTPPNDAPDLATLGIVVAPRENQADVGDLRHARSTLTRIEALLKDEGKDPK